MNPEMFQLSEPCVLKTQVIFHSLCFLALATLVRSLVAGDLLIESSMTELPEKVKQLFQNFQLLMLVLFMKQGIL